MAGFIEGLLQRGGFLFFIFLQCICGLLIVNFNDEQAKVANASWQYWSASFVNFSDGIRDYVTLRSQVASLKEENSTLREQITSSVYLIDNEIDSTYNERTLQRFKYKPVDIINKTPLGNNNFFLIDKGKQDSVFQGMGVIGATGLVGVVVGSSDRYARVMTLLHRQSRVSASIRGKPYFGTLVWRSRNPKEMLLDAIPKHANVAVNDTVVTSGFSNFYPADIPLGTIIEQGIQSGDNNLTIKVKLFDDILESEHAYVVVDLLKNQIEQTEQ